MRITASRKDDVLKRKAQYDADQAAYDERYNASRKAYREAEIHVLDPIKEILERKLSKFTALTFDVRVDQSWNWSEGAANGASVSISCNERNKFDENSALSWSWKVELDKQGNPLKESSSWSGLKATTVDQMTSLHQTVAALDMLNEQDWPKLLKVAMPKYEDFFDPTNKAPEYHNWDAEIDQAELEDSIGTNTWFCIANWGYSCPFGGYVVWINIIKDSGSQYTLRCIDDWTMQRYINKEIDADRVDRGSYTQRVRKSNVSIARKNDPCVVEVN